MLRTKEEIEAHVNIEINEGVIFNCHEVKMLRHKGNKRLKIFRLEFTWDKDGTNFNFSRRAKFEDIPTVIDGYVDEVNRIASSVG